MFLQKMYTLIFDLITIFNVVLILVKTIHLKFHRLSPENPKQILISMKVYFLQYHFSTLWPDLELHFLPETPAYK
jgi:hypothetical protein